MAKTTNTKKAPNTQQTAPRPEANSAPNQNKSALPIIAAVLFLAAYVCSALLAETGFHPNLNMFLNAFLIIALLTRRDKDLVPLALGLNCLKLLVSLIQNAATIGLSSLLSIYNITNLLMVVLTVLLALPNLRDSLRKIWWLPVVLRAVGLIIHTFQTQWGHTYADPAVVLACVGVYTYFFLCAWLASPDVTFKSVVDTVPILKYFFVAAGFMALWSIKDFVQNGQLTESSTSVCAIVLFVVPIAACALEFSRKVRQQAKADKKYRHTMNVAKANMGGEIGAQAKVELRKEAGKKAANAVIKAALIGDLIGGDTGAVVGAMAAKAKLDQTTGSDGSMGDVTKGAVVGGIIAGSPGAAVGGLAAQAQKDAEDGIK